MSDQTTEAQKVTPTPKAKPKASARVDHSKAIKDYATLKGIDTTRAGKLFRARLRANFDTISKRDPKHYGKKGAFKQIANDKRPWGTHSRAVLRDLKLSK